MALLLWLPFTKDTSNQGLSSAFLTPSYSSISQETSGKLGNCYKGGLIYHLTEEIVGNTWSVSTWVKADSWPTGNQIFFCKNDTTMNGQTYFSVEGGNKLKIGINGSYNIANYGYTFNTGVWYHVAATYDGNTYILYLNGSEVKTGTRTVEQTTGQLNIGIGCRATNAAGTSSTGNYNSAYFNDMRFYSHALSPREVSEIAKGLVLHYPLNRSGFGANNLHKDSNNLGSSWGKEGATVSNGIATIVGNGSRIFQLPANGDWTWQANTKYTASIEARSDDGSAFSFKPYGSNAAYSSNISTTTEWKRYYYTFTSSSSVSTSSMSYVGNSSIQVRRPKLELGDHATPWIPNSADTEYSIFGLNSTTVPDTSGYGHNGTATALTYSSDTPRYSVSPYFNGSTSKIAVPNIYTTGVKNTQMSFAFWMKRDDYDDLYPHYMYNDICSIYMYPNDQYAGNGYGLRISWKHDTASSSNGNTWATGRTIPADEWHHVCFTTKDGVMKLYIDGVMHSAINDRSSTGQYIGNYNNGFLGYRLNNGEVLSYGGELSDFRIYATALTADQVKQLYEAPISLANNGTLFANEFNET